MKLSLSRKQHIEKCSHSNFEMKMFIIILVAIWICLTSPLKSQCPSPTWVDQVPADTSFPPPAQLLPNGKQVPNYRFPIITVQNHSEVARIPYQTENASTIIYQGREISKCPYNQGVLLNWHNPQSWPNSQIPDTSVNGTNVILPVNSRILISSCSIPSNYRFGFITIPLNSSLVFADANITLTARGIIVLGKIEIGSPACRLSSNIRITLYGSRPSTQQGEEDKGITVAGSLDIHGALYHPTWTRLASTIQSNDTWIFLQENVNWEVGQKIMIATTALKDSRDAGGSENEIRTIVEVYQTPITNFAAIRVDSALNFSHYAGPEYQAEVSLLSRRIIVQGDPADSEPTNSPIVTCSNSFFSSFPCSDALLNGFGGHILIRGNTAVGRVSGLLLNRMGQTNFLGRYPLHFHMLGNNGNLSFVQDSTVWRSFFRCYAVHGTSGARLSRNVAYDAIGHCYYLEDGVEERNVFEYNLGAYVHMFGYGPSPPSNYYGFSQYLPDFLQNENLILPADIAASPFYITNAYNVFYGNAASGGWSGFAFPTLPRAIGLARNATMQSGNSIVPFAPNSRPTLIFNGNTAHSSGTWWDQAGCMYSGGLLQYTDTNSNILVYNPGRSSTTKNSQMKFENTKTFLCSVGFMHWGSLEEFVNHESHDFMRSMTIFGKVGMRNALHNCRSRNSVTRRMKFGSFWYEQRFDTGSMVAFQWYDTGQSHILVNMTFRNCNDTNPSRTISTWQFLTHSDTFLPDMMQATRAIRYETVDLNHLMTFNVVTRKTTSGRLQNWFDIDGTASLRGRPTIIGSTYGNDWWRLDLNCDRKDIWNVWLCDQQVPGIVPRSVGSILISGYDLYLDSQIGVTLCTNGDGLPCPIVGNVSHIGWTNLTSGLNLSGNSRITGPLNGFGWYVRFNAGAPKRLVLSSMQLNYTDTLMLVFQYPPQSSTTFNISAYASYCSGSWCLGKWNFRQVSSAAAVRNGTGDSYYYDQDKGHLYVKVVEERSYNLGDGKSWTTGPFPDLTYFTYDGFSMSPRTGPPGYSIEILSSCRPGSNPNYCDFGTTNLVEPLSPCPSGKQISYDSCYIPTLNDTNAGSPSSLGGNQKIAVIVGSAVGATVAFVAVASAIYVFRSKRLSRYRNQQRKDVALESPEKTMNLSEKGMV